MSFNILKKRMSLIFVGPSDTLSLIHNNNVILVQHIEKDRVFDTVIIFETKDEFGLENGIGGMFGKSKDNEQEK